MSSARSRELNSRKGFEGGQEAEAKQEQRGAGSAATLGFSGRKVEPGRGPSWASQDGEFQVDCFQRTLDWVFGICPGVSCMLGGPSSMEVSEVLTKCTRTELRCKTRSMDEQQSLRVTA